MLGEGGKRATVCLVREGRGQLCAWWGRERASVRLVREGKGKCALAEGGKGQVCAW